MEIVLVVVGVLVVLAAVGIALLERSITEGLKAGVITWFGLLFLGMFPGYLLYLTSPERLAFAFVASWAFWAGHLYFHLQNKPPKWKIRLWAGFAVIFVLFYLPGLTPIAARWEEEPRQMHTYLLEYPPEGLPWPREAEFHFLRDRLSGRRFMVLCGSRDFIRYGEAYRASWLQFAVSQYPACNQYMGALEIYANRPD